MIRNLNRKMRKTAIIVGAVLVTFKLIADCCGKKNKNTEEEKNGFQTEEFDDIW